MKCHRCEGLMVQDTMLDMEETGRLWVEIWRCVQCGNAEDPRININRCRLALRRAAGLRARQTLVSA